MMIKKILILIIFITTFLNNAYSAGSSDGGSGKIKSNYDKAVSLIKSAKKFEKKSKEKKANKNYKKAQKLLVKSNNQIPNKADTLNYLGFTTRKLGDYENGEKFYLQGLDIEPNHKGINEYLGELYVATNRINLAKERLKVLESCNCKEFKELKEVIEGTKKSKY
jgi:tetratricopeptide (TPR) repeat protein